MRVIHPCYYLLSRRLIGQPACFFEKPDGGFDQAGQGASEQSIGVVLASLASPPRSLAPLTPQRVLLASLRSLLRSLAQQRYLWKWTLNRSAQQRRYQQSCPTTLGNASSSSIV
jgi:hypothetical protein